MAKQKKVVKNNTTRPIIIGDLGLEIPPKSKVNLLAYKTLQEIALSSDLENVLNSRKLSVIGDDGTRKSTENAKKSLKVANKTEGGSSITITTTTNYVGTITQQTNWISVKNVTELTTQLATLDQDPFVSNTIVLAPGDYYLTDTLNFTEKEFTNVIGAGRGVTRLIAEGNVCAGAPVVDMTDSSYCSLSHLSIIANTGDNANRPSTGLLVGRPIDASTNGIHVFDNLEIDGYFTIASHINIASEVNTLRHCYLRNKASISGGAFTYFIGTGGTALPSGINPLVALGTSTMLNLSHIGCEFVRETDTNFDSNDSVIKTDGTSLGDLLFESCSFYLGGTIGTNDRSLTAKSLIQSISRSVVNHTFIFRNCRAETAWAKSIFDIQGASSGQAGNTWGVEFLGGSYYFSERFLYADIDNPIGPAIKIEPMIAEAQALYDWGYNTDGFTFNTGGDRCLIDIQKALTANINLLAATIDTTESTFVDGIAKPYKYARVGTGVGAYSANALYATTSTNYVTGDAIAVGQKDVWT